MSIDLSKMGEIFAQFDAAVEHIFDEIFELNETNPTVGHFHALMFAVSASAIVQNMTKNVKLLSALFKVSEEERKDVH